ncbi:MAG: hypothetical protein ACTSUK_11730 [Promethearchaeota archaeon]
MKQGFTFKAEIEQQELYELLSNFPKKSTFIYAQQVDKIFLDFIQPGIDLLERGRIFNQDLEIRYQRLNGNKFKLLTLTEDKTKVPAMLKKNEKSDYEVRQPDYSIFLWGKAKKINKETRFIEVRIPQILKYPIPDSKAFNENNEDYKLSACDYLYNKVIKFTRLKGVEKYVVQNT